MLQDSQKGRLILYTRDEKITEHREKKVAALWADEEHLRW